MIGAELFKEASPLSSKDCFIVIERLKSTFNFPIHVHPEYELNFIEHAKGVAFGTQAIDKVRPLLKTITCETDGFYSIMKLFMILHELSLSGDYRELSSHSFTHQSQASNEDIRMLKVTDYLNQNYDKQVRLSEVAELINMSEPSLCRNIKLHTSKSFVDLLTDIRLGFAIRALIDSPQSVAEIGFACGFNNLSNFNRIFKKKKGMSPTEFRENYRKKKVII